MTISVRVEMPEVAGLIARLGSRAPAALKRAVTSIRKRALATVEQETHQKRVVNSGRMLSAWFAREEHRGDSYGVLVGNTAPYAAVMEYGRRPGKMPPVEAIARWAQRKLRLPYAKAKSVGFVIARSIARKGIKGRFILTSATMQDRFKQIMEHELLHELLAEWEQP